MLTEIVIDGKKRFQVEDPDDNYFWHWAIYRRHIVNLLAQSPEPVDKTVEVRITHSAQGVEKMYVFRFRRVE